MSSNSSILRPNDAARRARTALLSSAAGNYAESRINRLLDEMSVSHAVGTSGGTAGFTVSTGTSRLGLFDIEDGRFLAIYEDSGGINAVVIQSNAAADPTLGTNSVLGTATSISNYRVYPNPTNPRQYVVAGHQNSTNNIYLITVDASGTGFTSSSINVEGGSASILEGTCAIVWGATGAFFAVAGVNVADVRLAVAVFTVSGTAATYVTRAQGSATFAAISNSGDQGGVSNAWLTGEAANKAAAIINAASTNAFGAMTFDFTASSCSITQHQRIALGGGLASSDYTLGSLDVNGRVAMINYQVGASLGGYHSLTLDSAGIVECFVDAAANNYTYGGSAAGGGRPVRRNHTAAASQCVDGGQLLDLATGRHLSLVPASNNTQRVMFLQHSRRVIGRQNIIPTGSGYNNTSNNKGIGFAVSKDFTRAVAILRYSGTTGTSTRIFGYNLSALGI